MSFNYTLCFKGKFHVKDIFRTLLHRVIPSEIIACDFATREKLLQREIPVTLGLII